VELEPVEQIEDVTYTVEIQRGIWGSGDPKPGESGPWGEWEIKKETTVKITRLAQHYCLWIERLQAASNNRCTGDAKHASGEDYLSATDFPASANMGKVWWLNVGIEKDIEE
jgi:hypothetical protein